MEMAVILLAIWSEGAAYGLQFTGSPPGLILNKYRTYNI